MFATLSVDRSLDGILRVRLNRPTARNAMDAEMIRDLTRLANGIGASEATRAIILSGAGRVFCAGADLTWMQAQIAADRATRIAEARALAEMFRALHEMPTPLIGAIHGGAFGAGLGLACVCDIAIAATGTQFGLTETRLGLIPATISPYVLARLGQGAARRLLLSSRLFMADDAAAMGLVARIAPPEGLGPAAEDEAAAFTRVAPGAVGRAKALLRELGPRIDDAVIARTVEALADAWETEEAAHGVAAFLDRRGPRWTG